jgi:hypothetical protein
MNSELPEEIHQLHKMRMSIRSIMIREGAVELTRMALAPEVFWLHGWRWLSGNSTH